MKMTWRSLLPFLGVAAAVGLTACGGVTSPGVPAVDTASVNAAYALARQQPNLTSLVIARDGVVERQEYFNGGGADIPQDVRSVTKSVTSLLIGIALERGCLRSVDQTVGELLGPLGPTDPAKAAITVRQLLNMTSGLGGDELRNVSEYNSWAAAPDQLTYVWDSPLLDPPGTRFSYYSPGFYVLSRILTRVCGQTTADFARDNLFVPLGIGPRQWETDDQGFYNGGAGLRLTPLDMVAIGNLVLRGGLTGGQQTMPSTWAENSTRMQVATNAQPYASGYGFGWWTGQTAGSDFAFANGFGGQFIVIVPRTRLVVTAATRWQNVGSAVAGAQWRAVIDIIMQRIVPAYWRSSA
jgi:CubicO group peptidase (beta-lactamase class C family)